MRKNEMVVACGSMGLRRDIYMVLLGNPSERIHFGYTGWDGRMMLRWIFCKWYVGL
jgi:hypothetical protein